MIFIGQTTGLLQLLMVKEVRNSKKLFCKSRAISQVACTQRPYFNFFQNHGDRRREFDGWYTKGLVTSHIDLRIFSEICAARNFCNCIFTPRPPVRIKEFQQLYLINFNVNLAEVYLQIRFSYSGESCERIILPYLFFSRYERLER